MNNLEGKGILDYNFSEDILYFYIDKFTSKNKHNYDYSFDLDGFIIDIDNDNHVIGLELLDATKKLNVDRTVLKFIKNGRFQAKIEKNIILISFYFQSVIRNKIQQFTLNAERLNTPKLQESDLKCEIFPSKI